MQLHGTAVHVREHGAGPPLLLINGIGAHSGMWRPLEQALPDVRLIAFDAPGTGRSPTPAIPFTIPQLAALAEELLARLGLERAAVLGYSFGGLVAQHLARRAPERVERLVLVATTPGWGGVPGSLRTLMRMSTPLRYYWRAYYEATIGDLMGGRLRHDEAFVRRHGQERRGHPPDPLGYAWQLAALAGDAGSLPWLHRVAVPALVVAGDDDPVMPLPNSLLLAHRLPRARLLVAPGEGHLLLFDPKSRALPAIRGFVRDGDWGAAEPVVREALDAGLRVNPAQHPLAAVSAGVRALWT
jgi:pimeloyl-ACP methyl ester carboxylesterase